MNDVSVSMGHQTHIAPNRRWCVRILCIRHHFRIEIHFDSIQFDSWMQDQWSAREIIYQEFHVFFRCFNEIVNIFPRGLRWILTSIHIWSLFPMFLNWPYISRYLMKIRSIMICRDQNWVYRSVKWEILANNFHDYNKSEEYWIS
jgi:hypothetical protein